MRLAKMAMSVLIFGGGIAGAAALAALRYDGRALHALATALALTGIAGAVIIFVIGKAMKRAPVRQKLAFYAVSTLGAAMAAAARQIGMDGILPRQDGVQQVGLYAVIANADLFLLVVAATALAGRGLLKRPDGEAE